MTSCFPNGSDPSIIAWVSGARWKTNLVFPLVGTIITKYSTIIKIIRLKPKRTSEIMKGKRPPAAKHMPSLHRSNDDFSDYGHRHGDSGDEEGLQEGESPAATTHAPLLHVGHRALASVG